MRQADLDAAVALARAAVGAQEALPADAWPVRRLDRDAYYVLVRLARAGEPGWLAAVDPGTGDVMTWAANMTGSTTVPALPPNLEVVGNRELVWRPSLQSRSPLYPLLRLETSRGQVFVDLSGRICSDLSNGRG